MDRVAAMTSPTAGTFDVAISGASFTGLAAALALTKALGSDLKVAIIDRAAGPSAGASDGRGFAIWAASKNALASLGVWDAIAPQAEAISKIEITDTTLANAVRPALLTYDAVTSSGEPAGYIVPAGVLHGALYAAVAAIPGVSWIAPAEATGMSVTGPRARIDLSDGRILEANLVIAAEGRASKLREAAGIKTVGWGYGQTGIVTTVQFSAPHNGVAIQHFFPGGPFAILPLPQNRACITWSAAGDEAAVMMALPDQDFLAELERRIGGRFGTITLAGPRQSWPLNVRIARALTAPNFALVGDSAHGVHPIAGQGVNLALRDVAALTESIADTVRIGLEFGHTNALERYERWRRFDSTMSAAAYDGLNRLFGFDSAVVRAVRDTGLGIVDRLPFLKRLIVDEAAGLTGELPRMLKGEAV